MADPRPKPTPPRPTAPRPTEPQHPGDARELTDALSHAPILDDWDLTGVRPVAGQGNAHRFFADDGEWEYQITVRRIRRSING